MSSTVYFLSISGLIKIGFTSDLAGRLRSLRTPANTDSFKLIGVIAGGLKVEKALHREFAAFSVGGDYFDDDPLVRSSIEDLLSRRGILGEQALSPPSNERLRYKRLFMKEAAFVEKAVDIIAPAIELALAKHGRDTNRAIEAVAAEIGIASSVVWSLRYRRPSRLTAATYAAIVEYRTSVEASNSPGEALIRAADVVAGEEN